MRACSANSIRFSRRFCCLISEARASRVSRSPYSASSCAAVFTPMPGTPGTLSTESPASDCTSITLSGVDAELLQHRGLAHVAVLHRVVERHAGADQLHQVLVGRDDAAGGAGLHRLARIGGDEIVGLEIVLLDGGHVEGAGRLLDQSELRAEIGRRLGALRLVGGIDVVPEGLRRLVEDHREMRGLLARIGVLQQLPQHVAETLHRAHRQAVGLAGERRQRVIGAEDVAGTVDQIEMVTGLQSLLSCHAAHYATGVRAMPALPSAGGGTGRPAASCARPRTSEPDR